MGRAGSASGENEAMEAWERVGRARIWASPLPNSAEGSRVQEPLEPVTDAHRIVQPGQVAALFDQV